MATATQTTGGTQKPRPPQFFKYGKPDGIKSGKSIVNLANSGLLRGTVQVVKTGAGDNNLHIHTGMDSFYMVRRGEVTFYGPDDAVIGTFGPNEGLTVPHGNAYWFASTGKEDLEFLQVVTWDSAIKDERIDVVPQKEKVGPGKGEYYDARQR
jgi:mannose-6-phosphate isomerase-like protein (cupin superfamily)